MQRGNQRQTRRLMERMGMKVEELSDVNQVVIRSPTKDIIIEQPTVTLTRIQGQNIYQIIGGKIIEDSIKEEILEEDVQLVAKQANVSLEMARKALEETKGDLAQAIILLAQRGVG